MFIRILLRERSLRSLYRKTWVHFSVGGAQYRMPLTFAALLSSLSSPRKFRDRLTCLPRQLLPTRWAYFSEASPPVLASPKWSDCPNEPAKRVARQQAPRRLKLLSTESSDCGSTWRSALWKTKFALNDSLLFKGFEVPLIVGGVQ